MRLVTILQSQNSFNPNRLRKLLFIVCMATVWQSFGQVVSGRLDLRDTDLSVPIELNGYWEFYWNQFVRPGKIPADPGFYYFPSLWNDGVVGGDTLEAVGFATYRLIISLDEEPKDYALFIEDFYTACTLYLNGEKIASSGVVSNESENYIPEWRTHLVPLEGLSGEVEIILQISNFEHSKGGANDPLKFGLKKELMAQMSQFFTLDIIITGLFLATALLFLLRFGFVTLDIASLYFSIFCLVYSYRIIGTDFYVLHSYLANYPWHLSIRMEYLSLFISPFLFAKYFQAIYPKEVNSLVINILGGICLLFAGSVLFASPMIFTRFVEIFFLILAAYFFYGFTIFTSAMLEKRAGSIYGFVGIVVVFANFSYLMLAYISWMPQNPWFSYVAYFLFLLFQTIQLVLISNERYREFGRN